MFCTTGQCFENDYTSPRRLINNLLITAIRLVFLFRENIAHLVTVGILAHNLAFALPNPEISGHYLNDSGNVTYSCATARVETIDSV